MSARNPEADYVDYYDWTTSTGIEEGPDEDAIRNSLSSRAAIKLRVSVIHLDANPEDPDYEVDWGWQEAVVERINDIAEFGEGSLTFYGQFTEFTLFSRPHSYGQEHSGSHFKSNYYPEHGAGAIYISIED